MIARDVRRRRGFTLPELLIVIAIIGILASIGTPNFQGVMQGLRVSAAANDFLAAIYLTRSEAIRLGTRVDLVPKDADGDWAKGWVVFVDENGNQRPDAGERVVYTHDAVGRGMGIAASLTDSKVQYLAYIGSGRTRTNASSQTTQFGTFTFRLGRQVRKIKLNFLGRPRVCNPDTDGAANC